MNPNDPRPQLSDRAKTDLSKFETTKLHLADGPCGPLPPPDPPVYLDEVMVQLQDGAVSEQGFSPDAQNVLTMLSDLGAKAETLSLPTSNIIPLSTGRANWTADGVPAVPLAKIHASYIREFGDGRWVGKTANDGVKTAATSTVFSLPIGAIAGGKGNFALQWAGDNSVTWSIEDGGALSGVITGTNDSFSAPGAPRQMAGTFTSSSVLKATVSNEKNTPSGFLVVGSAKAESGGKGRPVTAGDRALSAPDQKDRKNLRFRLQKPPSAELLRCLRRSPAVRFADRVPAETIYKANGPMPNPVAPSLFGANAKKGTAPPLECVPAPFWDSINRPRSPIIPPKYTPGSLAVLDDSFEVGQHGYKVWSVACQCLGITDGIVLKECTTGSYISNSVYDPTAAYFKALQDVLQDGTIKVITISRGATDWTSLERDFYDQLESKEKDILVVAAAGQGKTSRNVDYPAGYPTVLSVGGIDVIMDLSTQTGEKEFAGTVIWDQTNFSYNDDTLKCLAKKIGVGAAIDVAAPAVEFEFPIGTKYPESGTSFAAPMVAALCATIRSTYPALSALDVREVVRDAADLVDQPALVKLVIGNKELEVPPSAGKGIINWEKALQFAGAKAAGKLPQKKM